MDLFYSSQGELDLDDPTIYRGAYWDELKTVNDMRAYAWSEIGKSFVYMDFFSGDMSDCYKQQRVRVCKLAQELADNFHTAQDDTVANREWWKKFIFRFNDEVENQC